MNIGNVGYIHRMTIFLSAGVSPCRNQEILNFLNQPKLVHISVGETPTDRWN
jgi:hypothetical protein